MKTAKAYARHAGDAYFMALDSLGWSSDIVLICDLNQNLPAALAIEAFNRLVESNEPLQLQRKRHARADTWEWLPDAGDQWRKDLVELSLALKRRHDASAPAVPCGLPFRLHACNDRQLVFRIDHTFANGYSCYWWVDRYFAIVSRLHGLSLSEERVAPRPAQQEKKPPMGAVMQHAAASLWRRMRIRSGWSDIRRPLVREQRVPTPDCRTMRFVLPDSAIQQHVLNDRLPGESYTQALTRRLVEHTFRLYPPMRGLGVQIAADLHQDCGASLDGIGNFTGLITGYVDRQSAVHAQIGLLFDRIRSGGALGFSKVFALVAPSPGKMVAWLKPRLKRVMAKRGEPLMDALFTISNLGVVKGHYSELWLASTSAHTSMPSIYLSTTSINGRTAFLIDFPIGLFDEKKVTELIQRFFHSVGAAAPQGSMAGGEALDLPSSGTMEPAFLSAAR